MLCALYMTPWMLGKAGWYAESGYREFLFFIPFHQYFLFGPVMYFLTLSLTGESWCGCRGKWLHFLPACLYLLYSLVIVITDLVILDQFYFYSDGMDKDFKPWYQITGLLSMCIYACLSIRQYIGYKKWIYEEVSFVELVKYRWLRDFLIALMLIIIFRGLFIIIFPEVGDWGFKWWYYLMFAIISYYLGLSGLMNSIRVSALELKDRTLKPVKKAARISSSEDMERLISKVNSLFLESQVYKQANLTLTEVAKTIETNTSLLSKAINDKAAMNFNDFVNSYRIEAVKEAIMKGELKQKTLVGIAMDQGFNSKSTFIRSFKKIEGTTPSAYCKSLSGSKS